MVEVFEKMEALCTEQGCLEKFEKFVEEGIKFRNKVPKAKGGRNKEREKAETRAAEKAAMKAVQAGLFAKPLYDQPVSPADVKIVCDHMLTVRA